MLDVLATVLGAGKKKLTAKEHAAPVASLYGIMMSQRNSQLSAWTKMSSVVGMKANMRDTVTISTFSFRSYNILC